MNLILVWYSLAFVHLMFLTIKAYKHIKPEHELHFWLGTWIFKSEAVDEDGLRYRNMILIFSLIYFLGPIVISR